MVDSLPRSGVLDCLQHLFNKEAFELSDDKDLIAEAKRRFDLSPVIKQYGTWAITTYGMECLVSYYPIKKARLLENEGSGHGWDFHMKTKRWINMNDFLQCFEAAKRYHFPERYEKQPAEPQ